MESKCRQQNNDDSTSDFFKGEKTLRRNRKKHLIGFSLFPTMFLNVLFPGLVESRVRGHDMQVLGLDLLQKQPS